MKVFTCDHCEVVLPPQHRFPMGKYAALRRRLVAEGVVREDELRQARPAPRSALLRAHDARYVDAFLEGTLERRAVARIGFPWSAALVRRTLASAGATLAAARAALEEGLSGALAGGTHHAHRDYGAGYCIFNDVAVAAHELFAEGAAERVLVFDVDVHQGDGTAALFAGDPRVFTCSLHGERNFPARKAESDLDVGLPDGAGDEEYLAALRLALESSFHRSFDGAGPDFVFYQGGVDGLAEDRLGRLSLTAEGLAARDELVLGAVRRAGVPLVLTLGGGYAEPIEASIAAHVNTYRVARRLAGP